MTPFKYLLYTLLWMGVYIAGALLLLSAAITFLAVFSVLYIGIFMILDPIIYKKLFDKNNPYGED